MAFYVGVPRSSQDLTPIENAKVKIFLILRFTPVEYLTWLADIIRYALHCVKRRRLNNTLDHLYRGIVGTENQQPVVSSFISSKDVKNSNLTT